MGLPLYLDIVICFDFEQGTFIIIGETDKTPSKLHIDVGQTESEEVEKLEGLLNLCIECGQGISVEEEYDNVIKVKNIRVSSLVTEDEVNLEIKDL